MDITEGEFSFDDMIAADERKKNDMKINTAFEEKEKVGKTTAHSGKDSKEVGYNTKPSHSHTTSSFESPPPKKSASDRAGMLYGHGQVGDEDKTHAMITTDCTISFMPPQCWLGGPNIGIDAPLTQSQEKSNGRVTALNAIVSSFLPCGMSVAVSSTTDLIQIRSFGVVSFRVLFSRDMDKASAAGGGGGARATKPQVQIKDIQVPTPDRSSSQSFASPSDSYKNNSPSHSIKFFAQPSTTSIKTPWPCSKVEAMIMQRNMDFPCILDIRTYSSSSIRSSAASTPQMKNKQGGGKLM